MWLLENGLYILHFTVRWRLMPASVDSIILSAAVNQRIYHFVYMRVISDNSISDVCIYRNWLSSRLFILYASFHCDGSRGPCFILYLNKWRYRKCDACVFVSPLILVGCIENISDSFVFLEYYTKYLYISIYTSEWDEICEKTSDDPWTSRRVDEVRLFSMGLSTSALDLIYPRKIVRLRLGALIRDSTKIEKLGVVWYLIKIETKHDDIQLVSKDTYTHRQRSIRSIVNRKRFEHFDSKFCVFQVYKQQQRYAQDHLYHKLPVTIYTQLVTWWWWFNNQEMKPDTCDDVTSAHPHTHHNNSKSIDFYMHISITLFSIIIRW